MLKFDRFTGINNVLPEEQLVNTRAGTPLRKATNVDINTEGRISRRGGFAEASAVCHKNVWQAEGFMLATAAGGELVNVDTAAVLQQSLGVQRVWYVNLPDGRTAYSNGLINGVTDGATATTWGPPLPDGVGEAVDVVGQLAPGKYRIATTNVRLSDGREGGATYRGAAFVVAQGGVTLMNVPVLAGHKTNVYLSSVNGDNLYLAGSTVTGMFAYTGKNDALVTLCKTDGLHPAPVGTVCGMFGGRVLVAVGKTVYASKYGQYELFDLRRDHKTFEHNVTLIQEVDDGVYIGTEGELAFLAGDTFETLAYKPVVAGRTVLGSGVPVRAELIQQREGAGIGSAMVCIANGTIVAGFNGGNVVRMSESVYRTTATEVAATFRKQDDTPQYIAIPQ